MQTTGSAPVMAPLNDRSEAGLALAEVARDTSEFARGMMPGAAVTVPGVVVGDAVRLVELAREVLRRAVALELAAGASWEDLAAELGQEAPGTRAGWTAHTARRVSSAAGAAGAGAPGGRDAAPDPGPGGAAVHHAAAVTCARRRSRRGRGDGQPAARCCSG